jgi:hypothetical protein
MPLDEDALTESEQTAAFAQTDISDSDGECPQKEDATATSSDDSLAMLEQSFQPRLADGLLSFLQRLVNLGARAREKSAVDTEDLTTAEPETDSTGDR